MFQSLPFFENHTFKEMDRLTDALALRLAHSGIREGDRVAFCLPPSQTAAALFFAVWKIGASICPLSPRIPKEQIEAHLERLDARCGIDSLPLHPILRTSRSPPLTSPSALLFTSGSGGVPKIALLKQTSLFKNAMNALSALRLCPQDQWLLQLPLYHVGGIGLLLRCYLAGASVATDPRIGTYTHVSAVPTQLYRASPVYPRLKCLLIGGAPIPSYPEKLPCYLSYGLTEMGSLVSAGLRPRHRPAGPFLGFPLPGREVRLSDTGEIEVRGETLFDGYWEQGTIDPRRTPDGWFATGDLGHFSQEEGLCVVGRRDRQFISGGENIQPEEIERALMDIPEIMAAVVFPQKNPEYGEVPVALLQALPPFPCAAFIREKLKEKVAKFKIPRLILFQKEIPNQGLKIDFKQCSQQIGKKIGLVYNEPLQRGS